MANSLRWTDEQWKAYRKAVVRPSPNPPSIGEPKRAKYGNRKIATEYGTFDSEKEARRYADLVLLERAGQISGLHRQKRFALIVNDVHVCDYVADAVYKEGERLVVEDTKSAVTHKLPVFRIKKSLMLACYGISVLEV